MELYKTIEVLSAVCNLLYIVLLMKEKIACWAFGIAGSALGALLMFHSKLYSETILYLFYVMVGIYGWDVWHTKGLEKHFKIIRWGIRPHIYTTGAGLFGALLLGWFFSRYTDADYPWIDAHTTAFAFVASYMQAHKVLSSWIFWIVINAVSVWMYGRKDLDFYSGQMVLYFLLSIWGYWEWRKK